MNSNLENRSTAVIIEARLRSCTRSRHVKHMASIKRSMKTTQSCEMLKHWLLFCFTERSFVLQPSNRDSSNSEIIFFLPCRWLYSVYIVIAAARERATRPPDTISYGVYANTDKVNILAIDPLIKCKNDNVLAYCTRSAAGTPVSPILLPMCVPWISFLSYSILTFYLIF